MLKLNGNDTANMESNYRIDDNSLRLGANGAERLRITSEWNGIRIIQQPDFKELFSGSNDLLLVSGCLLKVKGN